MSILIKGMEMPKSCSDCPMLDWDLDYIKCKVTGRHFKVKEEPFGARRVDDCPLVPVPPHGRLIDADVLRCLYDPHDYGLDGEQADEYDRYHVSLPVIRQNIDDMPTIIPAEEGE